MWFAYALWPVDHNWEHLTPLKTLVADTGSSEALHRVLEGTTDFYDAITSEQLAKDWSLAKSLARDCGWEGDIKAGPSLFWLPSDNAFEYGFAFKQQNNGMTFVVSPIRLPWLEKIAAHMADSFDFK